MVPSSENIHRFAREMLPAIHKALIGSTPNEVCVVTARTVVVLPRSDVRTLYKVVGKNAEMLSKPAPQGQRYIYVIYDSHALVGRVDWGN